MNNELPLNPYDHIKVPLLSRIKASLIDAAVVMFMILIVFSIIDSLGINTSRLLFFSMIMVLMYEPLLVSFSSTIGQKIMGIEVVDSKYSDEKTKIKLPYSILRYITKIGLGWLSLLTIHSNPAGQAIHDKIGRSIVVYK